MSGFRVSGVALSVASAVVPGIGRVRAQKVPYAQAWRAANSAALREQGPLWVALGDSMSQGIGAASIAGGWVSQLQRRMAAGGRPFRLVNLSATGARIGDVVADQLPRLYELPVEPALVTVLVGANDMLTRKRRVAAVDGFSALLAELPATDCVVATLPRGNEQANAINVLIERAAAHGRVRVAELRGRSWQFGTLAEDHFHPNERGYASIASAFAEAIEDLVPPAGTDVHTP